MRRIAYVNRALWGVNLLLLVVVAVVAMHLLGPGKASREATPVSAAREAKEPSLADEETPCEEIDPKLILARDMFGVGQRAVDAKLAAVQSNPLSRGKSESGQELPLRLVGTIVDEKGTSYALLEDATTKTQDLYRVGDTIGDSRIDCIEQNTVFISRLGTRQMLTMVLGPVESKTGTAVATEPAVARPVAGGGNEVLRVVSDTQRQINVRASGASVDQATKLLSRVKLAPHATDGTPDGLRISGLGESVMAQLSGLKDGDVIRSVNGHTVTNQRKAAQVLQKARRLGTARVELTRGQEKRSLAFGAGSW